MFVAQEQGKLAQRLLGGRSELRILLAMGPQQPTALAACVLQMGLAQGVRLTVLFADLAGKMAFLETSARAAVRSGQLRLVALAGSIHPDWADNVDFVPGGLWDADRALRSGDQPVDLVLAEMTGAPGDAAYGYGAMIGYTATALETGARAVAVLRPEPDPVADAPVVPASRFDSAIVAPARESASGAVSLPSALQTRIAEHVADLIPNGAILQLGLGAIPEAVLAALAGKRDLGMQSGIVTTGLDTLVRQDVLTGRIVATGILRSPPASDSVLRDRIRLRPVSETHDPRRLQDCDRLWAINSALQVDLTGQANAEYIGGRRLVSGGGQSDFARAAHRGGGASVIALPSTTGNGQSRIVAALAGGHAATTAAQDIDIVVTEFGIARLRGRTIAERRAALIAIAHPDHRAALSGEPGHTEPEGSSRR